MLAPFKKEEDTEDHSEYTDEEWADILSEATICTEATRAGIIDNCIKSKYIILSKGVYSATPYGFYLVDVMNDLNIDLGVQKTVNLSRDMHDIAVGKKTEKEVLESTREMLTSIIRKEAVVTVKADNTAGKENEIIGICPRCGKNIYETAKAFSCEDKECGFALWKDNKYLSALGTKMNKTRAKAILKDGRFLAKGLKSKKSGKNYDAYITWENDGSKYGKFGMEFPKR